MDIQEIFKQRSLEYGCPRESFTNIAARWSKVLGVHVTPRQAILCMIELKKARLDYNPEHEDSKRDIEGYKLCLEDLLKP